MSNRILLNQSGLKVAAPGANVLTDSGANILFDSNFGGVGVAYRGSFVVPQNEWATHFAVPVSFSNNRFPYVLMAGYDASQGYTFTAGGVATAGIWHGSMSRMQVWQMSYGDNGYGQNELFFDQGIMEFDGPLGGWPPNAGPQAWPYTLNYVLLDLFAQ